MGFLIVRWILGIILCICINLIIVLGGNTRSLTGHVVGITHLGDSTLEDMRWAATCSALDGHRIMNLAPLSFWAITGSHGLWVVPLLLAGEMPHGPSDDPLLGRWHYDFNGGSPPGCADWWRCVRLGCHRSSDGVRDTLMRHLIHVGHWWILIEADCHRVTYSFHSQLLALSLLVNDDLLVLAMDCLLIVLEVLLMVNILRLHWLLVKLLLSLMLLHLLLSFVLQFTLPSIILFNSLKLFLPIDGINVSLLFW